MDDASTTTAPTTTATPAAHASADVVEAFVSLADSLVAGYDPDDLLDHLVECAVALFDLTAAGLLLADAAGRLRLVASSSQAMADLELFQLSVDEGPCLESFSTGAPVVAVHPGQAEERWPGFAPAMRSLGLSSVVAVPLRLREQTLGALGMFSRTWDAPGEDRVRIAQGLADVATIALLQERAARDSRALSEQLQRALDSRVLIEQAKGVVAAQLGTSVEDAFRILRTTARRRGTRLAALSEDLVQGRTDATALDA